MSLTMILALQAATVPPAPMFPEIDFDLSRLPRREFGLGGARCDRTDPNAIVVCGRRGGAYPLGEMARIFEPGRIVAETRLFGNVIGDAHVEAVPMDRGAVSNRLMLRMRLPF